MEKNDPIKEHFRLTAMQQSALRRLKLHTISDLLRHVPSRYDISGVETTTRSLTPGVKVTLHGMFSKLEAKKLWKSRRTVTEGWFEDSAGRIKVMWFNQPYMASYTPQGVVVRMTGMVGGKPEKPYIANPEVEVLPPGTDVGALFNTSPDTTSAPTLFPIYPESSGITSRWFYHTMQRIFKAGVHATLSDPIPEDVRIRYNLPDLATALLYIHTPEQESHATVARKRFSFEEMFVIQTINARERAATDAQPTFAVTDGEKRAAKFLSTIPFPPTKAQQRAINDILKDISEPRPMSRLIEGDVGAGKTLVAAAASYAVVTSRPPGRKSGTLQVAYMAPTEILAQQHFQSFVEYFKHLPINIALITGSGCKKFPSKVKSGEPTSISRAQLLKWVKNGEIALLVGTHAIIQKNVAFQHLALTIVDEQHRFGTAQRRALAQKNIHSDSPGPVPAPHFLSMTATPIPRTLALTIYGNLDLSVLDELPPGRAKVTTKIIKKDQREEAYAAVRAQLAQGRQAYVICPRIEEPDPEKINAVQAKSAKAEAKRLARDVFPQYEIGLLHGAMKPTEKDAEMKRFAAGETHILVATSVVEVGVNVPNATVIIIEGAERFGLAQLHQLRGRVMRSSHPPFCFLLPEATGAISLKRLRTLEKSSDGFVLAEEDLAARGAGDLYGAHQWGISDLGMEALRNPKLIRAAHDEASALVAKDPELTNHRALQERITKVTGTLHAE